MTNVEKLKELGILGAVRQRLGANSSDDEMYDKNINKMSNSKLVQCWCGWYLGDGTWWDTMKSYFDKLEKMNK